MTREQQVQFNVVLAQLRANDCPLGKALLVAAATAVRGTPMDRANAAAEWLWEASDAAIITVLDGGVFPGAPSLSEAAEAWEQAWSERPAVPAPGPKLMYDIRDDTYFELTEDGEVTVTFGDDEYYRQS